MKKFNEVSYRSHQDNISKLDEDRVYYQKNQESLGYYLKKRPLKFLNPFISDKSSWLTIGDMSGLEAQYLQDFGQDAIASDISDEFLKIVKREGLIEKYAQINVESIDFADNSFDFCFCHEAYHHFPRAYIGLYEMIRVSSQATILIEPVDAYFKVPALLFLKNILDKINPTLINRFWKNRFSFEPVGNYVFKLSEREVEKLAMGLGLKCIAFNSMNTSYAPIDNSVLKKKFDKKQYRKLMRRVYFKDFLGKLGIIPGNLLAAVVFKKAPSESLRLSMIKEGYRIIDLPENPYI